MHLHPRQIPANLGRIKTNMLCLVLYTFPFIQYQSWHAVPHAESLHVHVGTLFPRYVGDLNPSLHDNIDQYLTPRHRVMTANGREIR